ncbi:sugar kinase [Rheinheimera sp. MM224]|uniref:sugar kinase n=1 Tax=Rheinheimera sp. MM224 TaxID=3019969 RepID=UPI0021F91B3E|nr:sugar kinase [Rheinheimera sp. MM224]CAI3798541.1 2-dehydro-3-deoxygluconokinase [Rheinheimera sp. MM224]
MMAVLGEVMIELAPAGAGLFRSGVAGDTYNTAVMLSQLGADVCYATALGDDNFSTEIRQAMQQHGLTTNAVLTLKAQQPGLYCISNSANGERSFSYWRQQSAARQAFQSEVLFEQLLQAISHCRDIYWSGITLSLMSDGVLSRWLTFLQRLQSRGGRVYFDTNFRATLWQGRDDKLLCYQAALLHCDYFLPSLDDSLAIWGCDSLTQTLDQLQSVLPVSGPVPVICLTADQLVLWLEAGTVHQFSLKFSDQMLDATGAGDAFSGALIAALQQGLIAESAVQIAHAAASLVVQHQGAILPDSVWPQLQRQLTQLGLRPQDAKSGSSV